MKVGVKFYAHLGDLVNQRERLEFVLEDGSTVSHVLEQLLLDNIIRKHIFDDNKQLNSDISILVNGREIKFLNDTDTVLKQGDELSIFHMVAGG